MWTLDCWNKDGKQHFQAQIENDQEKGFSEECLLVSTKIKQKFIHFIRLTAHTSTSSTMANHNTS